MMDFDNYESGYAVGWDEGRHLGYAEGLEDCFYTFEQRLSAYWTELATLNARIDYLERLTGGNK